MTADRSGTLYGLVFTAIRALQLLVVLALVPLFSLFAVRLGRRRVPHPPYQLVFAFVITLLTFIYTTTTLLLHLCASLHYPTVFILDTTLILLFIASAFLLGLPLARLSCAEVPNVNTLPASAGPRDYLHLHLPALTSRTGEYSQWIGRVRPVCVQTKGAWALTISLGALFVLTAVCGWKLWWRRMPQRGEEREDEEEFMPVVQTPALDGVISEGSLRDEIERGLESRYTPSPWGRRRSVSVSLRQGL